MGIDDAVPTSCREGMCGEEAVGSERVPTEDTEKEWFPAASRARACVTVCVWCA